MKNKFLILGILALISLTGCKTTSEKIKLKYDRINFYNGISQEDAVLIGQNELLGSRFYGSFDVLTAEVLNTVNSAQHPRFWFVRFQAKIQDSNFPYHIVVIDKRSGGIVKSSGWWPKDTESLEWLFQ